MNISVDELLKHCRRWISETFAEAKRGESLAQSGQTGKGPRTAPVYGWFTEGFDTLDLKEAKALLQELA